MKHHLRKEMKAVLAAMSPEAAASKSRIACEKVIALDEFRRAGAVMLYMPIASELDATEIARAAWRHGKKVLVPRIEAESDGCMIAVETCSLDDKMVTGSFGIRYPADGRPWPIEDIDFIVVPALIFDRRGHRIGRGGGFYDRFLSQPGMRAFACGLAFAEQLIDRLPNHVHDKPVDVLVTEEHFLRF